jgi:hypothetical protein
LRRAFRTRTEGKVHSIQRENQPFSASLLRLSITKPLFSGERAIPLRDCGWRRRGGRGPGDGARSGPKTDGARRRPQPGGTRRKRPGERSGCRETINAVIAKRNTRTSVSVQSPLHWTSAPSAIPNHQTANLVEGAAARTAFSAGDRKPWSSRKMGRPKRGEHNRRSPRSCVVGHRTRRSRTRGTRTLRRVLRQHSLHLPSSRV